MEKQFKNSAFSEIAKSQEIVVSCNELIRKILRQSAKQEALDLMSEIKTNGAHCEQSLEAAQRLAEVSKQLSDQNALLDIELRKIELNVEALRFASEETKQRIDANGLLTLFEKMVQPMNQIKKSNEKTLESVQETVIIVKSYNYARNQMG